jgi:hypothetical protein
MRINIPLRLMASMMGQQLSTKVAKVQYVKNVAAFLKVASLQSLCLLAFMSFEGQYTKSMSYFNLYKSRVETYRWYFIKYHFNA